MISRGGLLFAILLLALAPPTVVARQRDAKGSFPFRLLTNFDYAEFTRFDAAAPPKEGIYQSNGSSLLSKTDSEDKPSLFLHL